MLPRWHLVLRLSHIMLAIMSILLVNYWGVMRHNRFNMVGIFYFSNQWFLVADGFKDMYEQEHIRTKTSCICALASMPALSLVVRYFLLESLQDEFLAWKDGCRGCFSVLQACFGVMVLFNCLEIIVAGLKRAADDDPSRSGGDIELMVLDNRHRRRVRIALRVGLFGGGVTGVLIRCGRVLGGFDRLVAWRLALGTMSAVLITLVLGAFGSVMTDTVFWTCFGLGFLETILVCANRQKVLDMGVHVRYVMFSGFKIGLVIFSIMNDNLHSLTESSDCEVGSACYSHLRECFWVMLLLYVLEVFLAVLLLVVHEVVHHPRQEIRSMMNRVVVNFFGLTLAMSLALSMTQVAIVLGLLLGGSYGPLMTAKGFWLCAVTGFVEMAALMGVTDWVGGVFKTLVDTRRSLTGMLHNALSAFILVPVLRIVELFIIVNFLDAGNSGNFIILDMSKCDETCMARGSDLLAMCAWIVSVQGYLSLLSILSILF